MDITKTAKTLNLAKKRILPNLAKKWILPNLAKKRILPKKWQSTYSRILDEAQERHEVQLNALVDEYKRNEDSENVAHLKAQNALLPLYRKELRKVLLEYLQWMRAMKDYTFQKVMETQKDLKDTDGFDWLESTELAIA